MEDQAIDIDKAEFIKIAETYVAEWRCIPDGGVFFTHSGLLWPVRRGDQPLMLKITRPDDDEAYAAEFLKVFDGNGMIKLYEADENIMLLERVESDDASLEQMVLNGQDDRATNIICDVIEELHGISPSREELPFLADFQVRFESMKNYVDEGRVLQKYFGDFQYAYDLRRELIEGTADTFRALHGDIHHFNILKSANDKWLSIDPKGFWGPEVYEYSSALCNPTLHTDIVANEDVMRRRLAIMSERSDIDKSLLSVFAFVHAMQVAAWCLSKPDQNYWLACAQMAAKISGIKLSS